jgi:hypothetical protein
MATWKSAVSLGKHIEAYHENQLLLPALVAAVQEEFRQNPFYADADIRHAVESLTDMSIPALKSQGLRMIRPMQDWEVLGECEQRLQMLEVVAAKDHRIYVSRVIRHFER